MRIICPACGSSAVVPANVRGSIYQCRGCGKRITVPETTEEQVVDPIPEDELESAAAAAILRPTVKRPKSKSDAGKFLIAGGIGAVATGIVVVLVMVMQKTAAPPAVSQGPSAPIAATIPTTEPALAWDRSNRAKLMEMKTHADDLAIAEQWRDAYEAYRQILALVADHDVNDPVVLQVVAGARVGQDRVLTALMPGKETTAAIVPPAPTTAASATTQAATLPVAQGMPATLPAVASSQPAAPALDAAENAADSASALPNPPPPPGSKTYALADSVTDQEIGDAIDKGIEFLRSHFRNGEISTVPTRQPQPVPGPPPKKPPTDLDNASGLGDVASPNQPVAPLPNLPNIVGQAAPRDNSAYAVQGFDALCVYALLHAGQATGKKTLDAQDPFVDHILAKLKDYNLTYTYHRSLRAAALAVLNRPQDTAVLEDDVHWLLEAGSFGAYTYTMSQAGSWDNSNSQYGLLGVWSGAMAGQAVPAVYWKNVANHWASCANNDGTFGYVMGAGSTTMTCAGVASLLVADEYLRGPDSLNNMGTSVSSSPALNNGINWLDSGDNCMTGLSGNVGYALYGLERVGLASGFKYFGNHDWYAELARRLVNEQHFDGSWGQDAVVHGQIPPQTLIDTSYVLLFLARGRHPILYNKLRYEGNWNNRPQDVAHLARFASRELEHPLNWQVVNFRRNWTDWMDSPVLYISGSTTPKLQPEDYDALRGFSNGGGLIFTHADNNSPEFTRWVMTDLARKLYPKYELMQVPRNHAIYSVVYQLKDPPPLLAIGNASRLLLIHSPTDLAGGWQLNWTDEKKSAFQIGINLFVYAAGKGNLKNRLASTYIPNDPDLPDNTRPVARLQYAGEWDPEPYAWARFRRYFQWETHQAIEPINVQLKDLKPGQVPIAFLTGTVRNDFTADEQNAAKAFVASGGVLMIDACGGQVDFTRCVERTLLPQAFEGVSPLPVGPTHPLLLASRPHADDLRKMVLRGYANENGGKDLPLEAISYGKGWVIFSRLDITTGLLGTRSWGILGYDPAYAQALVKNAVLWAEARSPAASN